MRDMSVKECGYEEKECGQDEDDYLLFWGNKSLKKIEILKEKIPFSKTS